MTGDEDFSVDFKWDDEDGWCFLLNIADTAPQYGKLSWIMSDACVRMDEEALTVEGLRGTPE